MYSIVDEPRGFQTMSVTRRKSRELALQALFYLEFNQDFDFLQCLEVFRSNFKTSAQVWQYAESLLSAVKHNRGEIDRLLQTHSSHWSLERMALVDLILMRIALAESLFLSETTPPKVAMNEALELAKKYSSHEASAFINGILDQVLRSQAKSMD